MNDRTEEFDREKLSNALNRIIDVVDTLSEKQTATNEVVIETSTLLKVYHSQMEKNEKAFERSVTVLETISQRLTVLEMDTKPHTKKIEALEKSTYAFKTIPMMLKLFLLITASITSGIGCYTLMRNVI